jgi:hypothetical protein
VQWAENRAGKGKLPKLSPFRSLIKPEPAIVYGQLLSEGDLTGPTSSTRVWVDDVNADGKLDVLVGDTVTLVSPVKGLSEAEFKKKFAEWQEAVKVASSALSSGIGDAAARTKASQAFNKVYSRRAEFLHEERTGFVWLYLQK